MANHHSADGNEGMCICFFLFSPFVVVVLFGAQCLIRVSPAPSHSRTVPGEFISFVREKEKASQKEEATL